MKQMEIETNENIPKNQDIVTLDVLPFKDHLKQENCNRIVLVKNIFDELPTGMKKEVFENYIPIMIRKQTQKFILSIAQNYHPEIQIQKMNTKKIIIQDLESNTEQIIDLVAPCTNAILTGASGAGKSYMLFHISYFCFQLEKWFVLYIPQFAELYKDQNYSAAQKILANLYSLYKTELFENYQFNFDFRLLTNKNPTEEEQTKIISSCRNLFSSLVNGRFEKHHVLIAIDQWNVLFRPKQTKEEEHILDFFKEFRSIKNGLFITAVSSTFDPVGKLSDADEVTYSQNVELYNEVELESMINHQKMLGYLPQQMENQKIQQFTGNVPRIVFLLYQTYQQNPNSSDWETAAKVAAIKYYKGRVKHILKKTAFSTDPKIRNDNIELPARIYLNKSLTNIPDTWEIAGIFTQKEDNYEFICEWAKIAFFKFVERKMDKYLVYLAMDEQTRRRAFELFVGNSFSRSSKEIELESVNLRGEIIGKPLKIELDFKLHIMQETSDILTKIEPGTFITCYENHPVIDFVAFSKKKQLFYIQASVSQYSQHGPKVIDLWKKSFHSTGKTLLEYYSEIAGLSSTRKKDSLPKDQFFLYITPYPYYMIKKTKYSSHPVYLINRQNLSSLNKNLWGEIQKFFLNWLGDK
eukprot:Anaeramoba_ignava/a481527_30.p1 GENE.a481527_30~~a481527_30.p1  ORF type:complete len:637 (-),score=177.14 a481527_30:144-2054(-)